MVVGTSTRPAFPMAAPGRPHAARAAALLLSCSPLVFSHRMNWHRPFRRQRGGRPAGVLLLQHRNDRGTEAARRPVSLLQSRLISALCGASRLQATVYTLHTTVRCWGLLSASSCRGPRFPCVGCCVISTDPSVGPPIPSFSGHTSRSRRATKAAPDNYVSSLL